MSADPQYQRFRPRRVKHAGGQAPYFRPNRSSCPDYPRHFYSPIGCRSGIFRRFAGARAWTLRGTRFRGRRGPFTYRWPASTSCLHGSFTDFPPSSTPTRGQRTGTDGLVGQFAISCGAVAKAASQFGWPEPCAEICTDRRPPWPRLPRSVSSYPRSLRRARRRSPCPRCPASGN